MSVEPKKSEEQLHYESLTSFLKYIVSVAGALMVAMASVAIYFSYSDRNSMRDEYEKTLTNVTAQIKDIKAEAKETENNIKEESRYDVKAAKEYSQNELSRIQTETHKIALDETEKQITDIFKSDKIQAIIEKNAIGELKDKLPATIADYTKRLPKIMEAAAWMRGGSQDGVDILKSYFNSDSEFEREASKKIYQDILNDYDKQYANYNAEQLMPLFKGFEIKISDLHTIVGNKYPTDKSDIQNLTVLMGDLNNKAFENNYGLYGEALIIKALSLISGENFELYDKDKVNKWFNGLNK